MALTLIASIMVEPREPGDEESTSRFYPMGGGYSSEKSSGPWSKSQRCAVRRAVARYLALPEEMNPAERKRRIDGEFLDPDVFEFHLMSGWTPGSTFEEMREAWPNPDSKSR